MEITNNQLENYPLFENISVLKLVTGVIDLHNDFDFIEFVLDQENKQIFLSFSKMADSRIVFNLIFEAVEIKKIKIKQFTIPDKITLDNLYRGKVECNGLLIEKNDSNASYFYLDFLEDIQFEFWALSVRWEFDDIGGITNPAFSDL
jgi:hypothetical protein